jgi:hypothetical protein
MSEIRVDTISEKTSANGVSIDSVKLKDGTVDVNGVSDGIILDADADTTISADTDDQIDFKTGGTDRVHINSSGNVGIGTSSIDVSTQSGGSGFQVLQIENNDGGQINLDHTDAGTGSTLGQINFQRAGEVVAEIEGVTDGATDNGKINFRTQPDGGALAVRWTIDHNGILFPGATSQGIALGVTAATSSNILDDYEEGTWTPAWATGFYAENGYLNREGFYTKVGRLVTCQFSFRTNTSGWTSNGNQMTISGVPFTMLDSEARAFGISSFHSFDPTAVAQIYGNNNSTVLQLYKDGDESFTQGSNHTAASGKYFIGGFSFITA